MVYGLMKELYIVFLSLHLFIFNVLEHELGDVGSVRVRSSVFIDAVHILAKRPTIQLGLYSYLWLLS